MTYEDYSYTTNYVDVVYNIYYPFVELETM
jgi:hypothetical protein